MGPFSRIGVKASWIGITRPRILPIMVESDLVSRGGPGASCSIRVSVRVLFAGRARFVSSTQTWRFRAGAGGDQGRGPQTSGVSTVLIAGRAGFVSSRETQDESYFSV